MSDTEEYVDGLELDLYSESRRAALIDNDEITPSEEAFMRGYEEAI